MPDKPPDSADFEHQRAHRRFAVEGVRGSFLVATDARVINLSIDGMAIESGSALKVGRGYSLKLTEAGQELALRGRVVWCSLVRTEKSDTGDVVPIYRAGVHFEDVLVGKSSQLLGFIREHAVVSLEQRLFGRFRIDRDKAAHLGCESEFQVRQLSLNGMLIEMDMAPQLDSRFETEIRMPELRFETRARIVRCDPVEADADAASEPLFLVGVEFVRLGDAARSALEAFLDRQVL